MELCHDCPHYGPRASSGVGILTVLDTGPPGVLLGGGDNKMRKGRGGCLCSYILGMPCSCEAETSILSDRIRALCDLVPSPALGRGKGLQW